MMRPPRCAIARPAAAMASATAADVDAKGRLPSCRRHLEEGFAGAVAGVVDEDVEPPARAMTSATMASGPAGVARSTVIAKESAASVRHSSATWATASAAISAAAIVSPRAASTLAVAAPSPPTAPVTSATFLSSA